VRRRAGGRKRAARPVDESPVLRPLLVALLLPAFCVTAVRADDEPPTIGGRDQVWWTTQARAHESGVEQLEQDLARCEEREAPPAYRNVPGQLYRGRDGIQYREVVRCDELRDELEAARQALDDFEDLARRLGVPPGWLR
jgi:hypothetical protein